MLNKNDQSPNQAARFDMSPNPHETVKARQACSQLLTDGKLASV